MIRKVISSGQTGTGRAALDVAISMDIPYGGWVPKNRSTEEGPLPEKYRLEESTSRSYAECLKQNMDISDGTLLISHGKLAGRSHSAVKLSRVRKQPCLHINLREINAFEAAAAIHDWVTSHDIEILHIAGPRASRDPDIYSAALKLLQAVLYMDVAASDMLATQGSFPLKPQTVMKAVENLVYELHLRDKTLIARMEEAELVSLHSTLGKYVMEKYGLSSGNRDLINSCRYLSGQTDIDEESAATLIIRELWQTLRKTHLLRVVK